MSLEGLGRRLYQEGGRLADRRRRARLRLPAMATNAKTAGIYFLTPDYDLPSGGIRVIYRHVDILNAAGLPAFVAHQRRGFKCTWFEHDTRLIDVGSLRIGPRDLIVLPELDTDLVARLPPDARVAIFNQNAHLTWNRPEGVRNGAYGSDGRVIGVATVSAHNEEMIRYAFPSVDVRRIRLSIDPELFHPAADGPERRISYMPRRGARDADQVIEMLRAGGRLDGWELRPLDGLSQAEVAQALRRSAIFMAFTYQEGFGLPAAEAMACGNYVVGYHGFGGREFFRGEFSAPIETGDVMAFARAVEQAISEEARNPQWRQTRGLAAAAFVRERYSPPREKADVVSLYSQWLAGDRRGGYPGR
jgi:glycosyltransferase involved in cell wall biosynthesis